MSPALILAAIDGILKVLEFINKVRSNNAVTAAWTPAQRADVDAKWADLQNSPHWQTDADRGGQ